MLHVEPVRRAFRRFVRIDCQVVRERDFRIVGDLAFDLSTNGMLVRATQRVLTGDELVVSFKPPRCNRWFDAAAVVARVIHGRRPGDTGPCLGIEFQSVDKDDEWLLADHLRGMNAPDPMRPPRPLVRSRAA
jgi:hypothetical protein